MSKQEEKNLTPAQEESTGAEQNAEPTKKSGKAKKQRTPEEERERALNKVKRLKKLKYGTLATVITVVMVAIVVMVNVICGVLDHRFNWNIDLTSSGLYEISADTISYLNQLNTDVEIVVMAEESYFLENSKLKVVAETLNRFKTESNGHISVKYVDMTANPEAIKQYTEHYTGDFKQGDVVVAAGELMRVVQFDDIIASEQSVDYSTYSYVYSYTFKGEQSLLSAIMGVTDLNPVHVAIVNTTDGQSLFYDYENYNFDRMTELLEKNNYQYTNVDMARDKLDAAAYDIVFLCAPYNDLTEAQIQKLNDFLYNDGQYGKNLVYFASIYQQSTPNLDGFLETWGLKVEEHILYEGNADAAQYVQSALGTLSQIPVATIVESDFTAALASTKLPTVMPLARPITQLFESNSGRTTQALLQTASTAFLYPLTGASEDFDQSQAETGVFNLAAVATQNFTFDNVEHTSTVMAFGSAWMLDYYIAQSNSYNNADYFVTVVNALAGKENMITIAEKSLDTTAITITDGQVRAIRTVVTFIIPLAVAVIGVVVFIRRKNR